MTQTVITPEMVGTWARTATVAERRAIYEEVLTLRRTRDVLGAALNKRAALESALDLILGTAVNDDQQAGEEELKARMAAIAHTARVALGV